MGEPLPNFPAPTHYPGDPSGLAQKHGLKPPRTVADAIDHMPAGATHNDRNGAPGAGTPIENKDLPLKGALRTHDWQTHYNANRQLEVREGAALQGSPYDHEFSGNVTETRRQVGNAFALSYTYIPSSLN